MSSTAIDRLNHKNPDYTEVYAERVSRLRRIRSGEINLADIKAYYADHPADFITDWCFTVDPRAPERGLPSTMPFILFEKQRECVDWIFERWKGREDGIIEKARDMGISWLGCAFSVWMWLFKKETVIGWGSRKESYVDDAANPGSLFWKIRETINLLPPEFRPAGYNERDHAPHLKIVNPENGSIIVGEAGDNIGRGNRTSIYFIDEAAFIERQELVDAALSQTSNCRIKVSTPNGVGNAFYRQRHSGKVKVLSFSWTDDPRKDQAWYRIQVEKLDPVVLAQEIDRDYSASVTNSWIPGVLATVAAALGPADVLGIGPYMVGVDVARFGDDKSVVTVRQGRLVVKQEVWGKTDLVDTVGRVNEICRSLPEPPAQIAVDTIGVGAGVADMLRRHWGDRVEDVNSSRRMDDGLNFNLRAYMWRQMRDWLANGNVSIPSDAELARELAALQYSYRGGLLLIEDKAEAKKRGIKSPDRADSLALTFAIPPRQVEAQRPFSAAWDAADDISGY